MVKCFTKFRNIVVMDFLLGEQVYFFLESNISLQEGMKKFTERNGNFLKFKAGLAKSLENISYTR